MSLPKIQGILKHIYIQIRKKRNKVESVSKKQSILPLCNTQKVQDSLWRDKHTHVLVFTVWRHGHHHHHHQQQQQQHSALPTVLRELAWLNALKLSYYHDYFEIVCIYKHQSALLSLLLLLLSWLPLLLLLLQYKGSNSSVIVVIIFVLVTFQYFKDLH